VLVALLAAVPAALADDPPVPWAGGVAVETPLEHFAGQLASAVAGRQVTVYCNGVGNWGQLAAEQRFDPVTVWGFVVFRYDAANATYVPGNDMQLSEAACWYLDQYRRAPASEKGKVCRIASQITFKEKKARVKVQVRVKVKGKWTTRTGYVNRTIQVPVEKPRYGLCPDYKNRVFALQTISHESQHLAGTRDEATAECNGMQDLPWFAQRFGATVSQSLQMAGDYYRDFYEVKRPGTPYYLPGCPNPAG
jgi:hypothetical protein